MATITTKTKQAGTQKKKYAVLWLDRYWHRALAKASRQKGIWMKTLAARYIQEGLRKDGVALPESDPWDV